jgi:threonine dehydrogenase-like Zn-dependent dehydrogenase
MKAVCWNGTHNLEVERVKDPEIINQRDAIIRITSTAICGSDLHLYDGFIPTMKRGDILGHEFMGEVVELGSRVSNLQVGDKVVVPFTISCGNCHYCHEKKFSLCDNSNPNAVVAETLYGQSPAGLFGFSHMLGGYAGGQAEYVRVPFADVGPLKIPAGIEDEKVLFLSDIFPTAWMAAENCEIKPGQTVAVWGCGPVGVLAMKSAYMMGAERVIGIDRFQYRLDMAESFAGAETINYEKLDVIEELNFRTGGRGPDACIDAVGLEGHSHDIQNVYDKVKTNLFMETDRAMVLRQAIQACRRGGHVSIPGVYGGLIDKMPIGAAFGKGLTFKMGQTHMHRYMKPLLDRILNGEIDPSKIISHRPKLDDVPAAYKTFRDKEDSCFK